MHVHHLDVFEDAALLPFPLPPPPPPPPPLFLPSLLKRLIRHREPEYRRDSREPGELQGGEGALGGGVGRGKVGGKVGG